MTSSERLAAAEQLLKQSEYKDSEYWLRYHPNEKPSSTTESRMELLARAQVQATLAAVELLRQIADAADTWVADVDPPGGAT